MKCLPDLEGWAKGVREEKRRRVMMMWQQLESMIQKKQNDCETDLGKKQDTSTVCLEQRNRILFWDSLYSLPQDLEWVVFLVKQLYVMRKKDDRRRLVTMKRIGFSEF